VKSGTFDDYKKLTEAIMVEVIPAIMPNRFDELTSYVGLVANTVDWVQVDVMDGKYTESVSWPYAKGSRFFEDVLDEDQGLPYWEKVNYELDLMVQDPYEEAPIWVQAGAARIILHLKSLSHRQQDPVALITQLKDSFVEVSIAVVPSDDMEELEKFVPMLDAVQFMGIEKVGFQGEPFVPEVVDMIAQFHAAHPHVPVSIDGGVNPDTAELLVAAGVTRLVSGSYIFTSGDTRASIAELRQIGNL